MVSGGHKRADLFQMCGLGMEFEKDARNNAWPVLWVSSSAQSLGGRVDAPVLLADVPARELVLLFGVLAEL